VIVLIGNESPTPIELDLTEYTSSATFDPSRPPVANQNTFGVRGQRRELKSIFDGSLALTFHHNYDDGEVTQTLWSWLEDEQPVSVRLRANDAPIGVNNPEWRFRVAITSLPVVDGGP